MNRKKIRKGRIFCVNKGEQNEKSSGRLEILITEWCKKEKDIARLGVQTKVTYHPVYSP